MMMDCFYDDGDDENRSCTCRYQSCTSFQASAVVKIDYAELIDVVFGLAFIQKHPNAAVVGCTIFCVHKANQAHEQVDEECHDMTMKNGDDDNDDNKLMMMIKMTVMMMMMMIPTMK
mmetsp:Transcript_7576/g.12011  ORF Transcript_7576/g.12011 Transcript_7576/m.12011 type:complete len:117 (+) Transcript_7576:1771-2121(+)